MKILQVAGSGTIGTDDMGPVSTDIHELAVHCSALGHRVVIADAPARSPRTHLPPSIEVVESSSVPRAFFPASRVGWLGTVRSWRNERSFIGDIASQCGFGDFDTVHLHEVKPAVVLRKLFRVPYVYTAHTPLWCAGLSMKQKVRQWLEMRAGVHEINVIRESSLTIALGDYLKEAVPDAPVTKILAGIDPDQFVPLDREEARKELGIEPGEFVVLFAGRITPVKGIDVLLKAVGRLTPEIPSLRLVIVGPPGDYFNMRDDVSEYSRMIQKEASCLPVEMKGFVSNRSREFKVVFSAADLFVLPSRFDAQGKVVMEAMAMGVPVVGSRTGGIPEMIGEEVGSLVDPGDAAALAGAIRSLYRDPARLASMRRRCREYAERRFSWPKIAEEHIEAFRSVLKPR